MKKRLAGALAPVLAGLALLGAPAESRGGSAPGAEAGRGRDWWEASARIAQEYDDNIALEPGDERQGSWKTYLVPFLAARRAGEQTAARAEYRPAFIYYSSRAKRWDINHEAAAALTHRFTRRTSLSLLENFLHKEDPQDVRPPADVDQRSADYDQNYSSLRVSHDLDGRISGSLAYLNEMIDYPDPDFGSYLNRVGHAGEAAGTLRIQPEIDLMAAYRYRRGLYDDAADNYHANLFKAGGEWRLARRFSGRIWAGYQTRSFDSGVEWNGPYVEIAAESDAVPGARFRLKYWYTIEDTYEISHRGYIEHGLEGRAAGNLGPETEAALDFRGILCHYPASLEREGSPASADERFFQVDLSLLHRLRRGVALEALWRYTGDVSDFPDASFRRSQFRLGISAEI